MVNGMALFNAWVDVVPQLKNNGSLNLKLQNLIFISIEILYK